MSPAWEERAAGEPESNVYSLALTVYECLSGANPVEGATRAATVRGSASRCRHWPRRAPTSPETFTLALDDCLAADAELRPTADNLAETLTRSWIDSTPEPVPLPRGPRRRRPRSAGRRRARGPAIYTFNICI